MPRAWFGIRVGGESGSVSTVVLEAYRLANSANGLTSRLAQHWCSPQICWRLKPGSTTKSWSLSRGIAKMLGNDTEERPRILARLAVALHWSDEPRATIRGLLDEATAIAQD